MKISKYILTIAAAGAFYAAFATGLPTDGLQAHFRADHAGRVVNGDGVVPTHVEKGSDKIATVNYHSIGVK